MLFRSARIGVALDAARVHQAQHHQAVDGLDRIDAVAARHRDAGGFLQLRPIDWHTPAVVLEKIIRYEAVHEISGWGDLRRRLDPPDRKCFAFFHPTLADDPLIFVEVALTHDIPDAIAPLLADGRLPINPRTARTAVFYSISNCQRGLAGISFGNFLIKRVVEVLGQEFRGLKQFATLSPVPGFCRWLAAREDLDITEAEHHLILTALQRSGNNRTVAAEMLGMSRRTLQRKLKDLNMVRTHRRRVTTPAQTSDS